MAIYYVDATGGDDTKAGTTTGTAWQTIGKVNGETFTAGDSVLFKRGETWTGTTLTGMMSRTSSQNRYRVGAKPPPARSKERASRCPTS